MAEQDYPKRAAGHELCPTCTGSGRATWADDCPDCQGTGGVPAAKAARLRKLRRR